MGNIRIVRGTPPMSPSGSTGMAMVESPIGSGNFTLYFNPEVDTKQMLESGMVTLRDIENRKQALATFLAHEFGHFIGLFLDTSEHQVPVMVKDPIRTEKEAWKFGEQMIGSNLNQSVKNAAIKSYENHPAYDSYLNPYYQDFTIEHLEGIKREFKKGDL